MPHPAKKGTMTPATATSSAVPPTFISSEALTSSPTRKSRNITPRSESVREEFGGRQPAKHVRADQDAGENFADDAGLSQALEDFRQKLGGREDQEHRERDLGGARHMSPLWRPAQSSGPARANGRGEKRRGSGLVGARLVLQGDCDGAGVLRRAALDVHGAAIRRRIGTAGRLRLAAFNDPHLVGLAGAARAGDCWRSAARPATGSTKTLPLGFGCLRQR